MTDLIERTIESELVEETAPSFPPEPPPPHEPPREARPPSGHWPLSAKVATAILAVAALAGGVGTIVGFSSDGEPVDDTAAAAEVATLTAERDALDAEVTALTERATTAEQERDDLTADVATLTQERDDLTADVATLTQERDDLTADVATLTQERDDLADLIGDDAASLTALTAERDALADRIAGYESTLARLRADNAGLATDLADVEAERDALADLFPITFDASLRDADLVGDYDVDWNEVYCAGFPTCDTVPAVDELTIGRTPEGYLDLEIDGIVTAGLFRIDGALYAIAESTEAVAACGTTQRVAEVSVTFYAHGITIADDGTRQIDDLGAGITIQAPAAGTCPAGLAFYGAGLTPQA